MRSRTLTSFLSLAVLATVAAWSSDLAATRGLAAGPADDWPCWLGPNHDGKSLSKGLLKEWPREDPKKDSPKDGPKQLWKASGIGGGYGSVAVAGGKVYITGEDKGKAWLSAFDLEGKLLWKVECGQSGEVNASPAVNSGNVYTLDGHGLLTCQDAETGKKKWSREAKEFAGHDSGWGYAESPLIYGDWIVFKPGGKNCIVALDKATGKEVWKSTGFDAGPAHSSSTPFVLNGEPLLVTGTKEGLVCVKAKTGELVWKNPFSKGNTANCPTPLFSDGYVFWANGYGKGGICMKVEPDGTAKEVYQTNKLKDTHMDCQHGGFIIDNGYVYGDNGHGVTCLELKTGKKMWEDKAVGKGSLCWADGMLYLFSENAGQAALATCSPDGFKITGKVKVQGNGTSWAHPAVAGGRLYLRYGDNLYCFDVKAK